jgi:hypothetical protein
MFEIPLHLPLIPLQNLYGGVKYLNELFYEMPDTHCTKPISIARGAKTKNAQACGGSYQQSLLKSSKKRVKKAAQKSYCENTPTAPQERYFECRYSPEECVSTAIAEASGQAALVQSVLTLLLVFLAVHLLGVPKSKRAKVGEVDVSETGFFGSMAMKAKDAIKTAKEKMDEIEEKKKRASQDGAGGDVEMRTKGEGTAEGGETPYIMRHHEDVTLESLQIEMMKQRVLQDAKVEELNRKIDMLLSAKDKSDAKINKFAPSSIPEHAPKDLGISKTSSANL